MGARARGCLVIEILGGIVATFFGVIVTVMFALIVWRAGQNR